MEEQRPDPAPAPLPLHTAPLDVVALVAHRLSPQDLAATRLVARAWRACFSATVVALRPAGLGPRLRNFPNLQVLGPPRARRRQGSLPLPPTADEELAHVAALTGLRSLSLSLIDRATSLEPLRGLSRLTSLDASRCAVAAPSGYAALAALTALRFLDCSGSAGFEDAALEHVTGLTRLISLSLNASGVRGPGLSNLQPLLSLRVLALRSLHALRDVDLLNLRHLDDLEELELDWCRRVRGGGLGALSRLRRLRRLSLRECGLDAAGVLAIGELHGLTRLDLDCNDGVGDGGVAALRTLTALHALSLADCPNLRGHGLAALSTLTCLQSLDLSDRAFPNSKRLSAAGFAAVGRLASLRRLDVGLCGFGDAHVAALVALTGLTYLSAHHSDDLTCAGAAALAVACPAIQHLDLHRSTYLGNQGVVALARLPRLQHLALHGCRGVGDPAINGLAEAATALTWLGLSDTGVRSLAPLRALQHLVHVQPPCGRAQAGTA
jgi:hypothetical protein